MQRGRGGPAPPVAPGGGVAHAAAAPGPPGGPVKVAHGVCEVAVQGGGGDDAHAGEDIVLVDAAQGAWGWRW